VPAILDLSKGRVSFIGIFRAFPRCAGTIARGKRNTGFDQAVQIRL
jgi:hypothetical protein